MMTIDLGAVQEEDMDLVKIMSRKLLSVIIPVYNKNDYLADCVESVLSQSYTNMEVILIDDGSTDGSDQRCMSFRYDRRVRVILQNNQGAASARKNAIEKATGEYVIFIDADDYIEKKYFEEMLDTVGNADIVTTGYFRNEDMDHPIFDIIETGLYHTREQLDYIFDNMIIFSGGFKRGITPYIWNKLFRTNLVKQVLQEINTKIFIGEDSEFVYRYFLKCSSIKITDICGYHYCDRNGSIVNIRHDRYLTNLNELYLSLKELFLKNERKESLMIQLQILISMGIRMAPFIIGFEGIAGWSLQYVFPMYEAMKEKRIILYGAGNVGRDYYVQLRNRKDINVVGWTDGMIEKYEGQGYSLISMEDINNIKYDYIIIAVKSEAVSNQIRNELLEKGITGGKIIWEEPIHIEL